MYVKGLVVFVLSVGYRLAYCEVQEAKGGVKRRLSLFIMKG